MGKPWSDRERALLRKMAGEASPAAIAAALGRSEAAVKRAAYTFGVSLQRLGERHPHARYSDADVEAIRALHLDGVRPREIAQRFPHIPRRAIYNFVYYLNRTTS